MLVSWQDVANDFELQGWAQDVAKEGLGWQDNDTKGMPEQLKSIEQLVSYKHITKLNNRLKMFTI